MTNVRNSPILSLCIPTYNRGERLDKLLNQIYGLSDSIKSKIQVCVSDNCSPDCTPDVIGKWQQKLNLVAVRQEVNIGLSRNFQAVVGLATSPWVLGMGDDDLLVVKGFEKVLLLLETLPVNTWVFGNILKQDGTTLLDMVSHGAFPKNKFKREVIFGRVFDSIGFISIHIMPRESVQKFPLLAAEPIPGWPNLALLFYDLLNIELYVEKECVIVQMGDGSISQTWRAEDWLCVMMEKTKLSCRSDKGVNAFSTGLAIREYLGWNFFRQSLYSAMVAGEKRELRHKINSYVDATNIHAAVKFLIKCYVFLLLLFPIGLIELARKIRNPAAVETGKLEQEIDEKDGMNRGI